MARYRALASIIPGRSLTEVENHCPTACLQPIYMISFLPSLIFLPTTHIYDFSPMFQYLHVALAALRSQLGYSSLAPYWFTLFVRKSQMGADSLAHRFPPSVVILCFSSCSFLCVLPASCWFLAWLTLQPWRWRRCVPLKCHLTFAGPQDIISQKVKALQNDLLINYDSFCLLIELWFMVLMFVDFILIVTSHM
jgi:hypothetical protein